MALLNEKKKDCIHIMNINEDPLLTGHIKHEINEGANLIGKSGDLKIGGLGIAKTHSKISFTADEPDGLRLSPNKDNPQKYKTNLNGSLVTERVPLKHGDYILFGNSNLYVVCYPQEELTED